jgi:heme/copper-type cytochrome/quinol oxidase subunit 2
MELLLILLAIIVAGVAIAKVMKAKELVDGLKDPESEPISSSEIRTNALGWLVFGIVLFVMAVVQMIAFDKYMLPSAASAHGADIDELMRITMILIMSVFFVTQGLLFWFGFKYYFKPGKKAFWFPHDNKLEMAWTVVPAVVLILLVTYGMSTWDDIMNPEKKPDMKVEFVSEQFGWTTRYAGADSTLGEASFALYGKNAVGIATKNAIIERLAECKNINTTVISVSNKTVTNDMIILTGFNHYDNEINGKKVPMTVTLTKVAFDNAVILSKGRGFDGTSKLIVKGFVTDSLNLEAEIALGWNKDAKLDKVESSIKNFRANVLRLRRMLKDYAIDATKYDQGKDDIVVNDNHIKLPKGKTIEFQFRSKDVIHSAYFPHFRAQMNTVPGMKTKFTFTPTETSEEFQAKAVAEGKVYLEVIRDENTGEVLSSIEKLGTTGYILLCNKVCGTSHFNMKVFIDVVEQDEFDSWLAGQKTFE